MAKPPFQPRVHNVEALCAQAGVRSLDDLTNLIHDLDMEIVLRISDGDESFDGVQIYAPDIGRAQLEVWPLSWPYLKREIYAFQTLLEDEGGFD
jgi:hypothetical protein